MYTLRQIHEEQRKKHKKGASQRKAGAGKRNKSNLVASSQELIRHEFAADFLINRAASNQLMIELSN
jgi:hypothetical protein